LLNKYTFDPEFQQLPPSPKVSKKTSFIPSFSNECQIVNIDRKQKKAKSKNKSKTKKSTPKPTGPIIVLD